MSRVTAILLLLAAGLWHAHAAPPPTTAPAGSNLDVAIEQALDEKHDIDIREKNILAAFDDITRQTGVRIVVEEGTLDRLPYGEQTQLSASIKGVALRDGLAGLLRPVGLVFQVRNNAVQVSANAPLRRIVRRATWAELDLLRKLTENPWSEQLWNELNVQFQDSSPDGRLNKETFVAAAKSVGAGPASEILYNVCNRNGLMWFPSGDRVVILSKSRQADRQLGRRVSLRFFRAPLVDVLLDLGREADMLVKLEPGVIASVPPHLAQNFSLTLENSTIRQAFEVISGTTGLAHFVEPDGIRIAPAPQGTPSPAAASGDSDVARAMEAVQANAVVGMVTTRGHDGGPDVSFFVRMSDLPAELKELHKRKLQDAVNAMRKALGAASDGGTE